MENSFDKLIRGCDQNLIFYTDYLKIIHNEKQVGSLANLIKKYEFYLVATILDLSITLKNIARANYDWERIYFTKNSFLIIYESSIHLKKLSDRNHLKNYIKNVKIPSGNLIDFSMYLEEFIKSEDYKFIETVRNKTSAHLDDKISNYYKIIYKLDGEKGALLASQYINILQNGFNLLHQIKFKLKENCIHKK